MAAEDRDPCVRIYQVAPSHCFHRHRGLDAADRRARRRSLRAGARGAPPSSACRVLRAWRRGGRHAGGRVPLRLCRSGEGAGRRRSGQQALASGAVKVRMGLHTAEPLRLAKAMPDASCTGRRGSRPGAWGSGSAVRRNARARRWRAGGTGRAPAEGLCSLCAIFQLGRGVVPTTEDDLEHEAAASSFVVVGRSESATSWSRLPQERTRLLTLSGPGGSGKTRLAIEAAAELVPEFRAGVFWADRPPCVTRRASPRPSRRRWGRRTTWVSTSASESSCFFSTISSRSSRRRSSSRDYWSTART